MAPVTSSTMIAASQVEGFTSPSTTLVSSSTFNYESPYSTPSPSLGTQTPLDQSTDNSSGYLQIGNLVVNTSYWLSFKILAYWFFTLLWSLHKLFSGFIILSLVLGKVSLVFGILYVNSVKKSLQQRMNTGITRSARSG